MSDDTTEVMTNEALLEAVRIAEAEGTPIKLAKKVRARKVTGKRAKKAPVSKKRAPKGPRSRKEKLPAKRKETAKRGPIGRPEAERIRTGLKGWGKKLRAKRLYLGYTQWQFAEILGIKQPSLCNLEKGTFRPSPKLIDLVHKKWFARMGIGKPRKGAPKP
jgi:DNA-binding XRE family transcriptional regulator